MISFDKEICTNFQESSSREWIETNGIGGFASSTVSGANTRRYHGLLTAATKPPLGRVTMLSKFEETLILDNKKFELSSNQYPLESSSRTVINFLKIFALILFRSGLLKSKESKSKRKFLWLTGKIRPSVNGMIKSQKQVSKFQSN